MPPRREWHAGPQPPLGWAETILKSAGIVVAVGALVAATDGSARDGSGPPAATAVLAVLGLGLVAAIGDRMAERDALSLVFILGMNVGHWSMLAALARDGSVGDALVGFAGLMLAGDAVKLVFLGTSGFRVRHLPRGVPIALTGLYAAGYVALIAIELTSR